MKANTPLDDTGDLETWIEEIEKSSLSFNLASIKQMFLDGDDFAQLASNELKTKRLTVEEEFKDIQLELTQLQSLSANHEQQLEALQQSTQAFEEQIKVDKQEDALLALEKECLVLEEEELELKKELEQLNSHTDPDANPKTVIELYISMYRELGIHVLTKDGAIGKTRLTSHDRLNGYTFPLSEYTANQASRLLWMSISPSSIINE